MAKNKLTDLRDHLFETLERLKDDDKPLDVTRAHAICAVSREIIETAKVEVRYAAAVGALPNDQFFDGAPTQLALGAGRPNGRAV